MHTATLLLSALSAGALTLAFPTTHNNDNNTHPLLPRRTNANIAAYSDAICTIPAGPKLPLNIGDCVKIGPTPPNHNMGINWGTIFNQIPSLGVFTDDECTDYAAKLIERPESDMDYAPKGANDCLNQASKGGPWRSVRAMDDWGQNP